MRRAWLLFSPMVFAIAYVACVGDDPGAETTDAGNGNDASTTDTGTMDTGAPGSDSGVDASNVDAADAADAADPCAVPPSGAGFACTPALTCPKGQNCCTSSVNGQRDCVSSATGCAGASIPMQCAAKGHCSDGNEVCCLETSPIGTTPSGTCPATVNSMGSFCGFPTTDAGCNAGQIRLCAPSEPCSAGKSCQQIDINVGTGTPYRTGACL